MPRLRIVLLFSVVLTLLAAGASSRAGAAPPDPYYLRSSVGAPFGSSSNEAAMDAAFGAGSWVDERYETVDVGAMLAEPRFIFMEGGDGNADEMEGFLTANASAIDTFLVAGGVVFFNAAPSEGDGMAFPDAAGSSVLLEYDGGASVDNGPTTTAVAGHPIFDGPFATTTAFTGSPFSRAFVTGTGLTSLIDDGQTRSVLAELAIGSGRALYGGMSTPDAHLPQPDADALRANILVYGDRQVRTRRFHLIGVTGDGAAIPESLYLLDRGDASVRLLLMLGNGGDGEAIGYHAGSGLIFHASGYNPGDRIWESVDLIRRRLVTSDQFTGTGVSKEIIALVEDPSTGRFLVANRDQILFDTTLWGEATQVGPLPGFIKGLAFVGTTLYGASQSGDLLYELDPADGSVISSVSVTLGGSPVAGMNGLAAHPDSGELWGIFRTGGLPGTRTLGTVDPVTGVVTAVGPLPDAFANLAFVPEPGLVGVTGDGGASSESLFEIDPFDASASFQMALGNGNDGETIAANPDDGLLYHASGTSNGDRYWESINVGAGTIVTSQPFTGPDVVSESLAMVYDDGADRFLVADRVGTFFESTLGGSATTLGTVPENVKGLAFAGGSLYGASRATVDLYELSPVDGSQISFTGVTLLGKVVVGMNGLATHPYTDELWGVFRTDTPERLLGTVDPVTGVVTPVGKLTDNFAGIAFLPEPGSLISLGAGALAVALGARRRRRTEAAWPARPRSPHDRGRCYSDPISFDQP